MIRSATIHDAEAIAKIYSWYVLNTVISFEVDVVTAEEMAQRISAVMLDSLPWLVMESAGQIVGYAYASKWKGRCSYRFSVETTVYVDEKMQKQGIGSALYAELLTILRGKSLHVVMGGIALPNETSVALHEKFGFQKVAHFKEVGFKFDRWVDVGYWQLTI